MSPIVTVIMSVYNEKTEWLKQSIDSILKQTFTNYEYLIICDNPSFDDGIRLLKEYASRDKRIRVLMNEKNIGLTKSLNRGIVEAEGKYIVRMDADDIAMPSRIEKQVAFMESHPDVVASGTGAYFLTSAGCKRAHRYTNNRALRSRIFFDSPIFHPSAIIRRVIGGSVVYYNEEFKYSQDYALWISLMQNYEISNIDEPLIKYRISDQQISTSKHGEQREYALRNQRDAIELLNLELSEDEKLLCQDLTRRLEVAHTLLEVTEFVVSFMKMIKKRKDLDYGIIASQWLLIYVNRIYTEKNLISSLIDYLRLCFRIKYFSLYSVLSLISKYLKL